MSESQTVEAKVNVKGNFSGNLVAGNYNLVVNNPNGGVVNVVQPSARAAIDPRTRPVNLRPRNFPGLLDRAVEAETIRAAVEAGTPATIFGENGIGKTALLRKAAYISETKNFQDGVVYLLARDAARDDLLQEIHDAFFTSSVDQKPTDGEIRNRLKDVNALIILDDLTLGREDAAFLLDAMPQSLLLLASVERALWGEGQVVALDGLPEADALQLFQRELGRTLSDDEKPVATQICKILLFHPLRILQTASLIREDGLSIPQAFQKLTATRSQSPVVEVAVQKSSDTQKKIFSVLAVAAGFALTRDHISALVSSAGFDADMNALIRRGLVREQGTSLSLSNEAAGSLLQMWDLSGWEDAFVNHFSDWLKTGPQDMLVDQLSDLLFHLMKRTGEKKQWPQLVKLGQALERISILQKKWQRWVQILDLLRMAARALADKKLEGWVLHQMGTRSMCLGAKVEAQEFLKQALNLRHAIGDKAGLQVTQNNLNVLLNLPLAAPKTVKPRMGNLQRLLMIGAVGGGAGIILLMLLVGGYFLLNPFSPPPTEIPFIPTATQPPTAIPPSQTFQPTRTPLTPTVSIPTRTPTRTLTPTPTATPRPVILFDFIAEADKAVWEAVSYYGTFDETVYYDFGFNPDTDVSPSYKEVMDGYDSAYAGWEKTLELEDDSVENLVVLAFPNPQDTPGYINGYYDLRHIPLQKGDVFRARVGHIYPDSFLPSPLYDVTFQVYVLDDSEKEYLLAEVVDYLDGKAVEFEIPIPEELFGRGGIFILKVYSGPDGEYDWSAWLDAVLIGLPR